MWIKDLIIRIPKSRYVQYPYHRQRTNKKLSKWNKSIQNKDQSGQHFKKLLETPTYGTLSYYQKNLTTDCYLPLVIILCHFAFWSCVTFWLYFAAICNQESCPAWITLLYLATFFLSVKMFHKVNQPCKVKWSYSQLFISTLFIRNIKLIHYLQSVLIFPRVNQQWRTEWSYFQLFISALLVRTTILYVCNAFGITVLPSKQHTFI